MTTISAIGTYLPKLRLTRASMAAAMNWLTPGTSTKGSRTLAFWDEDSISMGVAAARAALTRIVHGAPSINALCFATTTPVFAEPQNAAILHAALQLPPACVTQDSGGSGRGALVALQLALERASPALIVAADCPVCPAGSMAESRFGDGAVAAVVCSGPGLLTYLGGASLSAPFIDRHRAAGRDFAVEWEERWVREEGFLAFVPQAIAAALKQANLTAADISYFVLPCAIPGCVKSVAECAGLGQARLAPSLDSECGNIGSGHALLALALAMETMNPGEKVLVAQFGQGATALILEATDQIDGYSGTVSQLLASGLEETNYLKLPIFRGLLPWDGGLRGRTVVNEALSTAYRNSEALLGFVGGRCRATGAIQFPPSRLTSSGGELRVDSQEPWPLAALGGTVATSTADRLAFSRHPPNCYGLIDINGGGRLMMDFTDPDAERLGPGDAVDFVFRVKDHDDRTGYRRYFWKAVAAQGKAGGE